MPFLCLQSLLASVMPCDIGLMGIPAFTWVRDSFMWIRRVSVVGGPRALIAWAFLPLPLHAETNRVQFPELDKLVHYTTVKRGNVTEHIMTTREAIAAIKQGRPAPPGTHFVLVDYREGKVHRYFVMQKEAGWGADYDARRRTGDWQFQWFWADRSVNLRENTARCQSCHDGRKDSDYLYTANRIAEFDKTPVE